MVAQQVDVRKLEVEIHVRKTTGSDTLKHTNHLAVYIVRIHIHSYRVDFTFSDTSAFVGPYSSM